ncbi:MAG: hypothetical protein ACPL06_03370 [Candidatus Anstonellales archaeon]
MMDDVIGIVMAIVALGILASALMYVSAERESAVEKQAEISYKYVGAIGTIEKAKNETYKGRSILVLIADSIAQQNSTVRIDEEEINVEALCYERDISIGTNYWGVKDGVIFGIDLYNGEKGVVWVK